MIFVLAAVAGAIDSFDLHCANIAILQDKRIQREIGITEPQRNTMNQFASAHTQKLQKYQKELAGKRPDMNVLNGYMEDLKNKVCTVLTASQMKRLRELNLQAAGLLGLMDDVVAAKIGMSKPERDKFRNAYVSGKASAAKIIRAAILPIDQKYQKLAAPYKGKEQLHKAELEKLAKDYEAEARAAQQRVQPQVSAIEKQTQQKLQSLITAKEKAAWLALQGKPYSLPKS